MYNTVYSRLRKPSNECHSPDLQTCIDALVFACLLYVNFYAVEHQVVFDVRHQNVASIKLPIVPIREYKTPH